MMARCARGEDVVEKAVKIVVGLVVKDRHCCEPRDERFLVAVKRYSSGLLGGVVLDEAAL